MYSRQPPKSEGPSVICACRGLSASYRVIASNRSSLSTAITHPTLGGIHHSLQVSQPLLPFGVLPRRGLVGSLVQRAVGVCELQRATNQRRDLAVVVQPQAKPVTQPESRTTESVGLHRRDRHGVR